MNPVIDNFEQILFFAKNYGLAETKKRAILREYLQVKILDLIYQEKISLNFLFVGGTSLRLLRGLDRFSEDLDFDLMKISFAPIKNLMLTVGKKLKKEAIELDLYQNLTPKRIYFEFRFKNLLSELKISRNLEEKLIIKFDFEKFWRGQKREAVLLKRYGFLVNILTIPLNQMLVQKLFAYTQRKQTLARDLYDIIWLAGREIKPDKSFIRANALEVNLITKVQEKFLKEKSKLRNLKEKLKPFLINEERLDRLDLFPDILEELKRNFYTTFS